MNKKFIFSFLFLSVLAISFASAGFFQNIFSSSTGNAIVEPGVLDMTPRISYWWGKVNQHTENGVWKTDPDGSSGALLTLTNAGRLSYCQKWYPETVDVREYAEEYIVFNGGRNQGEYPSVKMSYECVQSGWIDGENSYFPSPFLHNGVADFAIVYGSKSGMSMQEVVVANNIQSYFEQKQVNIGNSLVKDSDFQLVWNKNLIVLGTQRICSNSAISNCNRGLKEGEFLIEVMASPSAKGKMVLLIYGYDVAELNQAWNYLRSIENFKISDGFSYKGSIEQEKTSCTDSDGGLNYYVKGKVYLNNSKLFEDVCVTDFQLKEYYCKNNNVHLQDYKCPNGCYDGACLKENETISGGSEVTYQGVLNMLNSCEASNMLTITPRSWSGASFEGNDVGSFCTLHEGKDFALWVQTYEKYTKNGKEENIYNTYSPSRINGWIRSHGGFQKYVENMIENRKEAYPADYEEQYIVTCCSYPN